MTFSPAKMWTLMYVPLYAKRRQVYHFEILENFWEEQFYGIQYVTWIYDGRKTIQSFLDEGNLKLLIYFWTKQNFHYVFWQKWCETCFASCNPDCSSIFIYLDYNNFSVLFFCLRLFFQLGINVSTALKPTRLFKMHKNVSLGKSDSEIIKKWMIANRRYLAERFNAWSLSAAASCMIRLESSNLKGAVKISEYRYIHVGDTFLRNSKLWRGVMMKRGNTTKFPQLLAFFILIRAVVWRKNGWRVFLCISSFALTLASAKDNIFTTHKTIVMNQHHEVKHIVTVLYPYIFNIFLIAI